MVHDSLFKISKPISDLPPAEIRAFKITSSRLFKFSRDWGKICVEYNLHNHTGSSFTYKINDEEAIDLKSLSEGFSNVMIYEMEIFGATDADLIVKLYSFQQLKALGALSNA